MDNNLHHQNSCKHCVSFKNICKDQNPDSKTCTWTPIRFAPVITEKSLDLLIHAMQYGSWGKELVSLDEPIHREGRDDDSVLSDFVPSDNILPDGQAFVSQRSEAIDSMLSILTEREEQVIRWRYGFERMPEYIDPYSRSGIKRECEASLGEIGQIYNLSRERVRQIEGKALKKMRDWVVCGGRKKQYISFLEE